MVGRVEGRIKGDSTDEIRICEKHAPECNCIKHATLDGPPAIAGHEITCANQPPTVHVADFFER
ncbi:hypothetical protein A6V36_13705 [Paraburkholderia ginsengiterrae]|uniref:Uncharacterized protein n=1 Tax=Paraburkholderia ginsengiterrae TaxID=1462993 RepID=A0A1A9MX00_9BURK|nr:hypothetical protein A6V36_13705 [Paraburkholderia ginsengiterrae]OAJ52662.1 hypothetical protein A6V37_09500 [Paraburkholderia ginsengiterrae]